jgi:hypothetical protein
MSRCCSAVRIAATGVSLLALLGITACAPHGLECRDIPHGAIPPPAGTYACQWNNAEMDRAARDQFVIYRYEWQRGKAELNSFGEKHLPQIAEQFACAPYPVVVEPSGDIRLDESRRGAITQLIAIHGVEVPADRVVLGHSEAEGLQGVEVPQIAAGIYSAGAAAGQAGAIGTLGGQNAGQGGMGNTGINFAPSISGASGPGINVTPSIP